MSIDKEQFFEPYSSKNRRHQMSSHLKLDLRQWPRPLLIYAPGSISTEIALFLQRAGYQVENVATIKDLSDRLERHPRKYALILLCHTLSTELQDEVCALASRIGIPTYQIEKPPHTSDSIRDIAKMWAHL